MREEQPHVYVVHQHANDGERAEAINAIDTPPHWDPGHVTHCALALHATRRRQCLRLVVISR
jgi:hypothetical protein